MSLKTVRALMEKAEKRAEQKAKADELAKLNAGNEDVQAFIQEYESHWRDSRDTSRSIETTFHPSWLGLYSGKCLRRAVYLLQGTPKAPINDSRIMRVFGNGHAVHERIQEAFAEMYGSEFEAEVPIHMDMPPIDGHADGVWQNRVLEIKSCSLEVFENRIKYGKPKAEHFDQANIYAYILGLDEIWFLYECKNDQRFVVFKVAADPDMAYKQIKKWEAAYKLFQDGELPVRPYKPTSDACMYCDVRDKCLSDPTEGVKISLSRKRTSDEPNGSGSAVSTAQQ